jgi:hypothetical protein
MQVFMYYLRILAILTLKTNVCRQEKDILYRQHCPGAPNLNEYLE